MLIKTSLCNGVPDRRVSFDFFLLSTRASCGWTFQATATVSDQPAIGRSSPVVCVLLRDSRIGQTIDSDFPPAVPRYHAMLMATRISPVEIQHAARLARLTLTETEIAHFAIELSAILDYFDQLQSVDTLAVESQSVDAISHVALRDDRPRCCLTQEAALANAPESRDGCFRVPAVLDGGAGA